MKIKKGNGSMANKNSTEKDYSKKIVILIIILVVLLSLVTSCSCTSGFLGELGGSLSDSIDRLFKREDDIDIKDDDKDNKEVITNKDLKFDNIEDVELDLDDENIKLSFNYGKINPKNFTCSTSDASIATCYVSDGHVIVVPKNSGTVKVSLQTTVNGKVYEATTTINIKKVPKSINLASNGGIIDLNGARTKQISYTLTGIKGDVNVKSTSNAVATAEIINNKLVVTAHKKGTATINISIIYNGKEYKDSYTVTVIDTKKTQNNNSPGENNPGGNNPGENNPGENNPGEDNPGLNENNNNYLNSITILNPKYKLDQEFNKKNNIYSMTTSYNEESLSIRTELGSKNSTVSYKLNGRTITILNTTEVTLRLVEGDNKLEIIVKPSIGEENTYVVNIRRPIRLISFEEALYNLYIKETYNIKYNIEEDGKIIDDYNLDDVKATLEGYEKVLKIEKDNIIIKPTDEMAFKTLALNLSYNNKNAITNLKILKYYINSYNEVYDVAFNNYHGEKDFIINTNMFKDAKIDREVLNNNKIIKISSKDKKFILELTVNGDNIKLEYIGNDEPKTSLPFKIVALNKGKSTIHVVGKVFGDTIGEFDISVNVIEKYIVKLLANGGVFNDMEDEYEFLIGHDEQIDLSEYDEPYKKIDNSCSAYKFKGYSRSSNGSIEYDLVSNKIIRDLTSNLTLYAIYDTTVIPITKQSKTLWLSEASIFFNKEYYEKYGEAKVIYPGAKGVYIMNFTNKTSNNITLTGLTLKENNICIENKGCLNMGYIIKHSKTDENDWTYYYGDKNDQYWVLNSHNKTIKEATDKFKAIIDFNDKKIDMKPNEVVVISLFWKWVEIDDNLDTLIGNHVAKKATDSSINDMYGISIGLNYDTNLNCD